MAPLVPREGEGTGSRCFTVPLVRRLFSYCVATSAETVKKEGERRFVDIALGEKKVMMEGDLKPGRYSVPPAGTCLTSAGL